MNERMFRDEFVAEVACNQDMRKEGFYWVKHKQMDELSVAYWHSKDPNFPNVKGWWDWCDSERYDDTFDYIAPEPLTPPKL